MSLVQTTLSDFPKWFRDMAFVLDQIEAPIAGSFALWAWQAVTSGPPLWTPADVDIWYSSRHEKQFFRDIVDVMAMFPGASLKKRGPAIVEICLRDDLPTLQFIRRKVDETTQSTKRFLDLFDLSVVQVVLSFNIIGCDDHGRFGFTFGDSDVKSDIARGTSRCFRDLGDSAQQDRLVKYEGRGFLITRGEIRDLKPWGVYDESHPK